MKTSWEVEIDNLKKEIDDLPDIWLKKLIRAVVKEEKLHLIKAVKDEVQVSSLDEEYLNSIIQNLEDK